MHPWSVGQSVGLSFPALYMSRHFSTETNSQFLVKMCSYNYNSLIYNSHFINTVSLRMEEMKKFIKVEVDLYPDAGGIAIIICNNYIGVNSKQPPLYGSIKDASEMDSTFKHIKFAIIKIDNAKRDIMINLIQAVAQYKFPDSYKSVVFIFSGHGNGKPAVISSDDLGIDLNEDIIEPLGVSETLEGKTKIALIAACRTIGKEEEAKPLTVYNKFLVAFSTRHGTGAYEKDNGCPWIQGLAKEIKKVSLSIGKILLKVNTEVKECTGQDSQFINSTVDICLGQYNYNYA